MTMPSNLILVLINMPLPEDSDLDSCTSKYYRTHFYSHDSLRLLGSQCGSRSRSRCKSSSVFFPPAVDVPVRSDLPMASQSQFVKKTGTGHVGSVQNWFRISINEVMHQDNLSSILYKSLKRTLLAGCQDSDQHIICCTVGKSMPFSPGEMSKSSQYQRSRRAIASTASSNKRGCMVAIHHEGNNEFQLMKITKEAKERYDFAYSWRKVSSDRGRRSSDIAGDLLRGVTELKESVILLQNLQDESILIDPRRSKSAGMYVDTGPGTNIGMTNARRFQATIHQTISEPPGHYAYLTSYHPTKGPASDDESSSPSRWVPGNDHGCTQLSFATANRSRQERALCLSREKNGHSPPTLVAKLMGLEAVPSERVQSVKVETIKNKFIEEEPFIVMPKNRKSLKLEQGSNLYKNGFEELKATALLNDAGTGKDHTIASCFHGASLVGKYGSSCHLGVAPIVVTKPMLMRYLEGESSSGFDFCDLSSKERENSIAKPMKLASIKLKMQETIQSSRIKPSSSPSRSYKKKERTSVTNGVLENGKLAQKPYLERRGMKDNKSTRSVIVTRSLSKPAPSLPTKPEKRPTLAKYHVSASTGVSNKSKKDRLRSLQHTRSSVKDRKISRSREINVRVPDATISISNSIEDNKEANSSQRRQNPPQIITSPSANHVSKEADRVSLASVKGRKNQDIYFPRELMSKPGQSGTQNNSPQAETELYDSNIINQRTHQDEGDIKSLLLSSRDFLAHAQQLLHLSPNHHINHQRQNKNHEVKSFNLILDCSDELLKWKIYQEKLSNHPLFHSYMLFRNSRSSLDDLTEEIVVMVQDLRSYKRTGDSVSSADSLYLRLEKDLRSNSVMENGGWDWGWIDGFCMEDSDQVVCDLEQLLTGMLVEEALMDHLCC